MYSQKTFRLQYELKTRYYEEIFVQSIAYYSRNYDLFYNETSSEIWSEDSMFFNLIHIL